MHLLAVTALALMLSSSIQSINAATTWSFCYSIVGVAAGGFQTSVTGTITTLDQPITVNGRQAYNITSFDGWRHYTDREGRNSTTDITGVYNLANGPEANYTSVDQLLYADWPYFDQSGVLYTFTGVAQSPYGEVSGDQVIQLWIDAVNHDYSELVARTRFNEGVRENNGTITSFTSSGGAFVVVNDGGASVDTIGNQCSNTYGETQSVSFCYYIESDPSVSSAEKWSVTSYGTVQANGPVTRRGRPAMIVQSASGKRVLTTGITASNPSGIKQTNLITGVRGIDQDEATGFVYNDNALYVDAPYLDDEGILFTLNASVPYANNLLVDTRDVQIYRGDIEHLYDEITPFVGANYAFGYATSNLSYFQYSSTVSPDTLADAKCQYADANNDASSLAGSYAVVMTAVVMVIAMMF
jgi:hypothetical protein